MQANLYIKVPFVLHLLNLFKTEINHPERSRDIKNLAKVFHNQFVPTFFEISDLL